MPFSTPPLTPVLALDEAVPLAVQAAAGYAQRRPLLALEQLKKSLTVLGDAEPLWARLERGEPMTLGVVGASVGMGGGCQRELQPNVRCADYDGIGGLKWGAYGCRHWAFPGERGFALRALDYINRTFPHADHMIHNAAVDATPAEAQETCILGSVRTDADAFLVEFGSTGRAASRLDAVERILRRLLRLPHAPPLFLINVREWCKCSSGTMHDLMKCGNALRNNPRLCEESPGQCELKCSGQYKMLASWSSGREDEFAAICRHYNQTCVSLRDAMYDEVMGSRPGFLVRDVAQDCLHPHYSRHGQRYLGDLVVHALQASLAAHRAARRSLSGDAQPAAARAATTRLRSLPPPLLHRPKWETQLGYTDDATNSWRCFKFVSRNDTWSRAHNERIKLARFAAEPVLPNRSFAADVKCRRLRECVVSVPAYAPGKPCLRERGHWQACPYSLTQRPARKPGIVATAAGATMRVYLDTDFYSAAASPRSGRIRSRGGGGDGIMLPGGGALERRTSLVQLTYLTSYNQMGIAEVTCEGGCSCAAQRVDAHQTSPTRNVSVVRTSSFEVSAAAACVLRFVVLEESSSGGGHKWKLTQVAVTPTAEAEPHYS